MLEVELAAILANYGHFPEFAHESFDEGDDIDDENRESHQPTDDWEPENEGTDNPNDEHYQALFAMFLSELGIFFGE